MFGLLLLLLPAVLFAQPERVVDGRKFIVHTVEAGQTLYAISRVHAVPVDAIMAANPGVKDGLSIGEEVLVPKDEVVRKEAKNAPVMLADGELLHHVTKRETLFGIARKYELDINDLLERNPQLASGLDQGMEVIIPVKKIGPKGDVTMRPAMPQNIVDHTVQPGETLFSLGQRYGIRPEVIQAANGGLPNGLKAGEVVRIPLKPGAEVPTPIALPPVERKIYKVGMLLPFSIARNDSVLEANALNSSENSYYEATRIAAQFYGGAQIALDSLVAQGLDVELTVLDMGDDQRTWSAALKDPVIKDIDLFIGPFHRSAIEQLARLNTRAHIVCPVQQSAKVILGHPTVSKVAPTRSDMVKHAARYVASRHSRDNIILLRPDIAADKELQEQMAVALRSAIAAQPVRYQDSLLVIKPGQRDLGALASKLQAERLNVIVAPSEDVEFVASLVTKLKPLAAKYRIALVGMESWLTMDPVAASDLDVLGFLFAGSTYADPTDPRIDQFTRVFRSRLKSPVDDYALLGFDVTYFYLKALMTQGIQFPEHFDLVHTEPLHMGFRMTRTGPENGFRNEHAIMLMQKDLQLVKAP